MRNSNIIYFEETTNFNQIVENITEVIQMQNTNNIHHATMRFKNLQEEFVNLLYTQFITGKYEAKVMSVNNKEDVYTIIPERINSITYELKEKTKKAETEKKAPQVKF